MKKLITFTLVILGAVGVLFLVNYGWQVSDQREQSVNANKKQQVLTIFNWGDYIDPVLIKKFEKETGYTFVEDAGRGYRRVVPSPIPKKLLS